MKTILNRLDNWFFAHLSATPLLAAKAGLGGLIFISFAWNLGELQPIFIEGSPFRSYERGFFNPPQFWSYAAYYMVMVSSLLFAFLPRSRWPGPLLLVSHIYVVISYQILFVGWSQIVAWPIAFLSMVPIDKAWGTVSAWPLRLLQLQVCGIYLCAAFGRLNNPLWMEGNLAFYFAKGGYSRIPGVDLSQVLSVLPLLTWSAWLAEFVLPVTIWIPQCRVASAVLLILLHLSMELIGSLDWWPHFMIILLICAFVLKHDVTPGRGTR